MKISVIIPVYNAAPYVAAAIDSVLVQPETGELLLIDDGSTDGSGRICMEKAATDPRIRILTHPGHANRGVSASRNLGLQHAAMPYVAFLDADDIYVENRFEVPARIFAQHPDADGVFEMTGARFINPGFRETYLEVAGGEISGIRTETRPQTVFRTLARGGAGYIHLNALTLRRDALSAADVFDPALVMGEDMDFILRLAARLSLYQGDRSRIVALRGIHGTNSIFTHANTRAYRYRYLKKCIDHRFYGKQDITGALYIVSRMIGATQWFQPFRRLGRLALPFKLTGVVFYLLSHPRTARDLITML